jgi:hypothetical protein
MKQSSNDDDGWDGFGSSPVSSLLVQDPLPRGISHALASVSSLVQG